MPNFVTRNTESELMDDPSVDQAELYEVFGDINRSNRLLGGNRITIHALSQLISAFPKKSYTIVDMGCGDGTMLRQVVLWSRGQKFQMKCIGIDLSENALTIAQANSIDFPEIHYLQQDILTLNPKDLDCDILLCTLTMHHFHNRQIPIFLKQFVELASIGVIINDLQRSPFAYYLFKAFSAIFTRTKIAKHDGLISIQSGFKKSELIAFSKDLPSMQHQIAWKWAFRYVWVMRTERLTKSYE